MAVAAHRWKKLLNMGLLIFRRSFNSSKCKTMAKMAVARVKLLRNKREVVIKQMRRDIAMLLESRQDATARIRVEHVIREQNIMAANELIELFCELIVSRLSIIAKQQECPADLKEGISSLIFAGPRCSEIPELLSIRDVFQKKYGKDFVSTATDLRPNAGVNRMLIEKLSVKTPSGETKLKVLKEIAKEYQVQWDTTESEEELLKPPEQRIDGPNNFTSATNMPVKSAPQQSPEPNNAFNRGQTNMVDFQDVASAAGVAAEKALAAAEAAAHLAACGGVGNQMPPGRSAMNNTNSMSRNPNRNFARGGSRNSQSNYSTSDQSDYHPRTDNPEYSYSYGMPHESNVDDGGRKTTQRRQSYNCQRQRSNGIKFDESDCDEEIEMEEPPPSTDPREMHRRHSYNVQSARYDARYDDEADQDDEGNEGSYRPPNRPAPQVPVSRIHPKLPDYDKLAARFEALKHHKT
ncbi:uncharacterized protein LOC127242447 [Andrographis paniculata]|uniref:uncharacterized protein LOC127242447 n=1 Tax=Andrographis paniculata TaxID=175694 RepID=UPI0021E6D89C|nr:uncharacterized protein LOC127242447 [Andrographis paniculata]